MHFLSVLIIASLAALTAANPVNDKIRRDLGCPPSFTTCEQTRDHLRRQRGRTFHLFRHDRQSVVNIASKQFDCNGPTSDCLQYCTAGLCFTCPGVSSISLGSELAFYANPC
jgi:hypothetical protein